MPNQNDLKKIAVHFSVVSGKVSQSEIDAFLLSNDIVGALSVEQLEEKLHEYDEFLRVKKIIKLMLENFAETFKTITPTFGFDDDETRQVNIIAENTAGSNLAYDIVASGIRWDEVDRTFKDFAAFVDNYIIGIKNRVTNAGSLGLNDVITEKFGEHPTVLQMADHHDARVKNNQK